jgi:site-specific DNA recombinase
LSPTGRVWRPATLLAILNRDTYFGEVVNGRETYVREHLPGVGKVKKKKMRPRDECVVLYDVAPAIVSEELAMAARNQKALNKKRSKRNAAAPELTLLRGGFIRCGVCGWNMHALTRLLKGKVRTDYICSHRWGEDACPHFGISARLIDGEVWSRVEQVLTRPEIVAEQLELQRAQGGFDELVLKRAEKQLKDAERKRDNLISELASFDGDVRDAIRAQIIEAQRSVTNAQGVVEALHQERDAYAIAQQQHDDLRLWLERVAENLTSLDHEGKRLALDALGVSVTVWPTTHEQRYEISMNLAPVIAAETFDHKDQSLQRLNSKNEKTSVVLRWAA